jgi:Predicted membrane protein
MWWKKQELCKLGVESLIYKFRNQKQLLLIFLSLGFASAGATIAMQEEIIAMVPVLVVLARNLKFDIKAIIGLTLGSSLLGSGFSPINPFNSLIGHNLPS